LKVLLQRPSFARLAEYLGAHKVSEVLVHERDRAMQRVIVCASTLGFWTLEHVIGRPVAPHPGFVGFLACYFVLALAYRRFLTSTSKLNAALLYVHLILDPVVVIGILVQDPETFAFLYPFVMVVVVRSGLRYGVRTMYFSWGVTVAASTWLMMTPFWSDSVALTSSYFLLLLLVPVFFDPLIRKIHNVRAIEAEHAKLAAATEANVARSAFLAKVSHELRSPLQGIVSAIDLMELRQGHLRQEDAELLSRMRRSSLLLNTQLRDLLTLARGEAGRLEVHPEPFEAGALVEALVDGARELAIEKDLQLVSDLPAEPIFVIADGARIDQVLTNIVINSIHYTERGQVRVKLHAFDASERRLRFSVADTGRGIPDAALPALLSPDNTLASNERRGKGSGLGLAIVRTLVQLLGGTVSVTSRVGAGTTFTVEIPAEPVLSRTADERLEDRTGRVLVIDDRADVLEALTSVVDELGFECDRASSAGAAANLLVARRYDSVLFDFDMPVKGGIEIARDARRGHGPNGKARFIGVSAATLHDEVSEPFDVILTKPVDRAALRRALTGGAFLSRPSQPGLWSPDD
jgi:signal transduction histidine kinase/CheY-like chemotaxis protein